MNSLPHANLFFLISTIGFIIVFLLVIVLLLYIIFLFKNILRITKKIEKDIDNIGDTTKDFVTSLWNSTLFSFIFGKQKKRRSVE